VSEPKLLLFEKDEPPVQSPSPKRPVSVNEDGLSHEEAPKSSSKPPARIPNDACKPSSTIKTTEMTLGGS